MSVQKALAKGERKRKNSHVLWVPEPGEVIYILYNFNNAISVESVSSFLK